MERASKLIRPKVPKTFYTTAEAADRLGVSIRTVQLWTENGLLQAWKTDGGHRRITMDSLERLLASPKPEAILDDGTRIAAPKPRFRILVVEDEPNLLLLYQMQLRRWRMAPEVAIAQDGFDALLKIGQEKPHLMITDLLMPHMDGFKMLRKLRSLPELADMEIVVVSGLCPADIAERGGLPGNIPVLSKPIPFEKLERIALKVAMNRDFLCSGRPSPGL